MPWAIRRGGFARNALKVFARHLVDDRHALEATQQLHDYPVPRVRAAARRALIQLTQGDP